MNIRSKHKQLQNSNQRFNANKFRNVKNTIQKLTIDEVVSVYNVFTKNKLSHYERLKKWKISMFSDSTCPNKKSFLQKNIVFLTCFRILLEIVFHSGSFSMKYPICC